MLRRRKQTLALIQRITSMRTPMLPRILFIDRIESPIGTMLLIHDPEEHVRALDFDDFEARMRRLLRLHHGEDGGDFIVKSRKAPAAIRQAPSTLLRRRSNRDRFRSCRDRRHL